MIVGGPWSPRLAKPGQIIPVTKHAAWLPGAGRRYPRRLRKLVVTASRRHLPRTDQGQLAAHRHRRGSLAHLGDGPSDPRSTRRRLVNKGSEAVGGALLYDIPFDRIEVVVHPAVVCALDGRVHRRIHDPFR
ncbi:hypothetical protein LT493_18480 [Streptomyces tricolor]|nr:hypothetical protein [Streptomyces tricolor]